jgi:hypothetical protein
MESPSSKRAAINAGRRNGEFLKRIAASIGRQETTARLAEVARDLSSPRFCANILLHRVYYNEFFSMARIMSEIKREGSKSGGTG